MMLTEQPNTSGIYDVLTHASKTLTFIRTIELESNRWPQGERGATFERLEIQARRRQPICSTAICYSWYRQNIFNLQTKSHLDSEWTCSILGWCCNILGWCCWSKTPRNPSIPRIWPWGFALLLKKQSHACGDSIHELQHSTHGSPPMHIRQRGTASRIVACNDAHWERNWNFSQSQTDLLRVKPNIRRWSHWFWAKKVMVFGFGAQFNEFHMFIGTAGHILWQQVLLSVQSWITRWDRYLSAALKRGRLERCNNGERN